MGSEKAPHLTFMGFNIAGQRSVSVTGPTLNIDSGIGTVSWTAAAGNFDALWALTPNPTRIIINRTGLWLVNFHVAFAIDATTTQVTVGVRRNGVGLSPSFILNFLVLALNNPLWAAHLFELNAGDYIELFVSQVGGTVVNVISPRLAVCLLSPYYPGSGSEER